MKAHHLKRIGLTGGMGAGKSSVAALFKDFGVPTLDADQVARELRAPNGAAAPLMLKRFGTLDPSFLRLKISTDPTAKNDLEAILHPLIKTESDQRLEQLEKLHPTAPFLLYEAALLVEANRAAEFAGIIVVCAPEALRIERIVKRDKSTPERAQQMLKAQLSDEERLQKLKLINPPLATIVIENDQGDPELLEKVRKTLERFKSA